MLKFITDRGNVTRPEIETFYRNGIRGFISDIVDEEFNKISFLMGSPNGGYSVILTRNAQNGHYKLNYEGNFNGTRQTKELSAASLEALTSAMSNSNDFSQDSINEVRAQAELIPAVYYGTNNLRTLNIVKDAITAFYETQTQANYDTVKNMFATFIRTEINAPSSQLFRAERVSFENTLRSLNPALAEQIARDARR